MFLCCFNKGKHEIPLNNRAGKIRKETTESFKENMPGMNRQRFLNGRNFLRYYIKIKEFLKKISLF